MTPILPQSLHIIDLLYGKDFNNPQLYSCVKTKIPLFVELLTALFLNTVLFTFIINKK